ncbi:TIGR03503 family protein [Saccharobesus litoralis]|uniref:TIGR03503 family protein n=1 Tax=Saccharobesus litoralis TaxID=2172099 RepID=A0A2S0VUH2_9ALTE|nr:TIGR03503 family protein [Saccharobesus litoralis]AWB67833.1 TIGR03503 family protein [Saccharobesus litoralis]
MLRLLAIIIIIWRCCCPTSVLAVEVNDSEHWPKNDPSVLDVISMLGSKGAFNGVKLLDNRFRIDYAVDEVTLIFFRKFGSSPVILIRPDGSKLYAPTIKDEEGDWFDDKTYDMIRLIKPMVGPWQVVGKLEDHNKIMVMSDIQLSAEPLPPILFQGETITINASLTNAGRPIEYKSFSDVVSLDVTFTSTNNSEYENFGADSAKVASFADDGKEFDQYPKDGKFTGVYRLNLPPGEWLPSMYLDLALFNRELTMDPLILEPIPFDISIETTVVNGDFHHLKIGPKSDKINFESFVFNGKAYFPNGEIEQFSLDQESADIRVQPLMNYEDGAYKIELDAFGQDINGRDVMIRVPPVVFTADPPPPPEPTAEELAAMEAEQLAREKAEREAEEARLKALQEEKERKAMIITVSVNVGLILIGIFVFWFIKSGKKIKLGLPKLNFKKAKKELVLDDADEKSSDTDDIIDLSLPEER